MTPMSATFALPAAMPTAGAACPIIATMVNHFGQDRQRVAMPHVEAQLVVRFGPSVPGGVDVHAMGPGRRVLRKFIRGGHRAILARLRPGTYQAALGVPRRTSAVARFRSMTCGGTPGRNACWNSLRASPMLEPRPCCWRGP